MTSILIGCGSLGEIILKGLLKKKKKVIVLEKSKKILQKLVDNYKDIKFYDNIHKINWDNIVYLMICIKPKDSKRVLEEIKHFYKNRHVIISFVAGLETKAISKTISVNCKIVRLMPNIFISSNNSSTAIFTKNINNNQKIQIVKDLDNFGQIIWIDNEKKFDFFTAMFGGGPAYFFYILECFNKLIIKKGFKKNDSLVLLSSLVEGTLISLKSENISLSQFIKRVASKGGTTEEALKVFKKNHVLLNLFEEALDAASKKSSEISKQL